MFTDSEADDMVENGKLVGMVALVTGGTSGIGRAIAQRLASEGAQVAFTGRRVDRGRQVQEAIGAAGGKALFLPADHTVSADCVRAVDETVSHFGGLDILVNNAGIVTSGNAESISEEDWARTLDINVTAVWRMSRLALPHLRRSNAASIVNIASDWGVVGARDALAYAASKGAVVQISRSMALDHAHEGIRVNALCPGDTYVERWTEDGYFEGSGAVDAAQALAESGAELPLGRVAAADEIAKAALFLASADSSFVTGTTLLVDGGSTAG